MTAPVAERAPAKRIVIFNHKGGVGKTTLTTNIAFALVSRGKRVLLVDSDPQCNLTSYLVADEVVNHLLDASDGPDGQTVWSAVKPIVEATGDVRQIGPIEVQEGLYLIPGDVRLAEFESELQTLWGECFQRRPRGFRGTAALSTLITLVAARLGVDYVFYDSGPNIGALNRVILMDSDFYIVPAACDLFSIRAIKTLGRTLAQWVRDWRVVSELAPDDATLFRGKPRLLAYIPQRFRVYGGQITTEYARFVPLIERAIQSDIVEVVRRVDQTLSPPDPALLRLGEVKDFASLAAGSQREGVAIRDVSFVTAEQQAVATATFVGIADQIIARTAGALT